MKRVELVEQLKRERSMNDFFSQKEAIIYFLEHPEEYDYDPGMHGQIDAGLQG